MKKNMGLYLVAAAFAVCTTQALAQAASTGSEPVLSSSKGQAYPVRPVRVIVPSQEGGGADIVARALAQKLTETWGQQVVVASYVSSR